MQAYAKAPSGTLAAPRETTMLKTIALAATLLAATTLTAAAQSHPSWNFAAKWHSETQALFVVKQKGVSDVTGYREQACTSSLGTAKRAACVADYNAVIARRASEAAEIESWLRHAEMPKVESGLTLTEDSIQEFNRRDKETTAMFERLWAVFPIRK
jgi:hypothetical protein